MRVGIIGAGPAGLTAAYLLAGAGADVTVFESDPVYVGGISRTARYKDFRFDIGGHRFFSKSKEVEDFWDEILPDDMLTRPRSSRIYYRRKFFSYPLRPFEALTNLGVFESFLCGLSYLKAQMFPVANPRNFEQWVTNQFGRRLFRIFFKTYTEKVWGMSCEDISADWAAQRIKGLSLGKAVFSALLPGKRNADRGAVVKTLINSFRYPRKGPGMMWEACAEKIKALGGRVLMGRKVTGCALESGKWRLTVENADGVREDHAFDQILSTTPVRTLVSLLSPAPAPATQTAARSLKYRDFLTVVLIMKADASFDDNWIYIHEPDVKVGRIQNFRSWSPEMVPDPSLSCYGLEYFCFEGDQLWETSDADLIALAKSEMESLGLARAADIVDGSVVRQPKAYPVYDDQYAAHVATIRADLEANFPTLHLAGRNGMHKYNNQDHSMMTAMLGAKNILAGERVYDVWQVNEDAEYHEGGKSSTSGLRMTPQRATTG
ncbi:MAG: NAD(P)/FAD-dependent oxidoreductase [Chthoniobacterales bacterium]